LDGLKNVANEEVVRCNPPVFNVLNDI